MAGTAAGPARAPRGAARPKPDQVAGGAFELVDKPRKVEREVLFTYRGKEHTIPKSFGIEQGLEYAYLNRTQGLGYAVDWSMEQALGTEGYRVLRSVQGLESRVLEGMVQLITTRMISAGSEADDPKA